MKIQVDGAVLGDLERASRLEWLETNGRGGFASSTVTCANTRRYHALLCAALDPPVRRHVLLSRVDETLDPRSTQPPAELGTTFHPDSVSPQGWRHLSSFRLDPFPVFTYEALDRRIEKAIFLVHGEDTVVLRWSLLRGAPCTLKLRPVVAFRDYHALLHETPALDASVRVTEERVSVKPFAELPALHFHHSAREVIVKSAWQHATHYPIEKERGLDCEEDLWSPFELECELTPRAPLLLVASLAPALKLEAARLEAAERARRAASVAVTWRVARELEDPLALATEAYLAKRRDGASTVIAGFPWFTDWGRDTMISLPGLCLATGRYEDARDILLSFARHVDKGMIPNRFPDSGEAPEYNNMDGTLWFVHAVGRWFAKTNDVNVLEKHLLPVLMEILLWHQKGTRYGIHMDEDGLLTGGEPGVQLTWMDAKVDTWVVTPRIGKPVEVNALWIEALETIAHLCEKTARGREANEISEIVRLARQSFVDRFWYWEGGYLYDVIDGPDGDDKSLRPNQVLALSLPHPAIGGDRARAVLEMVEKKLLTPYGLRTLSPDDTRYRGTYLGDRRERDASYHQGTVWPWLMGPYVRAALAVRGRDAATVAKAREQLAPLRAHLGEAGLGHVSEIFDAEPPFTPRGCFAQAWSVAELVQLLVEDLK